MVTKPEDNERLSEVKLILQGLQQNGIDRPIATATTSEPKDSTTALESLTKRHTRGVSAQKRRLGAFALATIAAGAVVMTATEMFFKYWPAPPTDQSATSPGPASATLPPKPVVKAAVATDSTFVVPAPPSPATANAKKMMDRGKIKAARELLLQPFLASTHDGAWLIARSYDPRYLATIVSPDAPGNREKAAEWYSRWRDIGAQNGVPMDDAHLRRLIQSLD